MPVKGCFHASGFPGLTLCGRSRARVRVAAVEVDAQVTCRACVRAMLAEQDLEYIRRAYGVPAVVGRRVEFDGRPGVITGGRHGRLLVLLDGDDSAGLYDPFWHMCYLRAGD